MKVYQSKIRHLLIASIALAAVFAGTVVDAKPPASYISYNSASRAPLNIVVMDTDGTAGNNYYLDYFFVLTGTSYGGGSQWIQSIPGTSSAALAQGLVTRACNDAIPYIQWFIPNFTIPFIFDMDITTVDQNGTHQRIFTTSTCQ